MLTAPGLSRVLISSADSALRLGRATAVLELRLPSGFHALPVDEQRSELERAASSAIETCVAKLQGNAA